MFNLTKLTKFDDKIAGMFYRYLPSENFCHILSGSGSASTYKAGSDSHIINGGSQTLVK
jgi:hypothetical protein